MTAEKLLSAKNIHTGETLALEEIKSAMEIFLCVNKIYQEKYLLHDGIFTLRKISPAGKIFAAGEIFMTVGERAIFEAKVLQLI